MKESRGATFSNLDFGKAAAEQDRKQLEEAFLETPAWHRLNKMHGISFMVGRKGSGKSAIAIRMEIECERQDSPFVRIVPAEFRHVEIRELLSSLVDASTTWQYIYKIVWEGILLGQIAQFVLSDESRSIYYNLDKSLRIQAEEFCQDFAYYTSGLDKALPDVIAELVSASKETSGDPLAHWHRGSCVRSSNRNIARICSHSLAMKRLPRSGPRSQFASMAWTTTGTHPNHRCSSSPVAELTPRGWAKARGLL